MKSILILLFLVSFGSYGQGVYNFKQTTVYVSDTLYAVTNTKNSFIVDLKNGFVTHVNYENVYDVMTIVKNISRENYGITLLLKDSKGDTFVLNIGDFFSLIFDNVVIVFSNGFE